MSDSLRLPRTIKIQHIIRNVSIRSDSGFSGTRILSPMTCQDMKLEAHTVHQYNTCPWPHGMAPWHNGPIQLSGPRQLPLDCWAAGATLVAYAPGISRFGEDSEERLWGKCVRICANRSRTEYYSLQRPAWGGKKKRVVKHQPKPHGAPRSQAAGLPLHAWWVGASPSIHQLPLSGV